MDIGNYHKLIFAGLFLQLIFGAVCEYPYNECAYCGCCAGTGTCDESNNYACDDTGCIDGYWGNPQCLHRCWDDYPCLSCGRGGGLWCKTCGAGFYLPSWPQNYDNQRCTYPCNSRCETCIGSSTNCQDCKNGYENTVGITDCSFYTCPSNCEACSSGIDCSECKSGFYDLANICNKPCLPNCLRCNDASTCTECKPGFFSTLQNNDCRHTCSNNCYSCTSYGSCTHCHAGYYGTTCQTSCSHGCATETCDKDNGGCISCLSGFTGNTCDSCVAGKYGYYCNSSCSLNCNGLTCHRNSGFCTEGCVSGNFADYSCESCKVGRHGTSCNQMCPTNCKDSSCSKNNGICTDGCNGNFAGETCILCITGMFGDTCTQPCPEHCFNDTCDKISGICSSCKPNYAGEKCEECANGYYGQTCNQACSIGCLNRECDKTNGVCLFGCNNNYSGDKCCIHHVNCALCSSTKECSLCVNGFYGTLCNNTCSNLCIDRQCEIENGHCTDCPSDMFGKYCEYNCSDNCNPSNNANFANRICNKESGDCIHGCQAGYYGFQCNVSCSENCAGSVCDKTTGRCTNKCVEGFHGPTCSEAEPQESGDPGVSVAVIGGGVGGTLAVIVIGGLVVVVLFVRKRRRLVKRSTPDKSIKFDQRNLSDSVYENAGFVAEAQRSRKTVKSVIVEEIHEENDDDEPLQPEDIHVHGDDDNVYYNTQESVPVSGLYQYVSRRTKKIFTDEFKSIPNGLQKPYSVSQKPGNMGKNRYKGIYPYDHSRVTVEGDHNFFLNANLIDGYRTKRKYIASLGPTIATTDKFVTFWEMVWHHKVDTIVMLTNLIENGADKCQQYWPDLGTTLQYGKYAVTGQNKDAYVEYTTTRLQLAYNGEDRVVHHLHFKVWPDKSVPEDVTSLVEFREKVNCMRGSNTGPIVVHCSAGVGRTGTYIALDKLTNEGKETGEVKVIRCVEVMREQRVNMIQTADQYEYLHKCLVYTLTSDCRLLSTDEMMTTLENNSDEEFTNIHQMLEHDMNDDDGLAREKNMALRGKNRNASDVPGDKWRPRLFLNRGFNDSDYINAIYVNSFTCANRFIIAQTPLPETIEDFLTLVYQTNVTCIVSLDDALQRGKDVGIYQSPDNLLMKQGTFTISSEECQSTEQYTERKLRLTLSRGKTQKEKAIQLFQFSKWPTGKKVPNDPASFVQFTKLVDKISRNADTEQSTILVHCLTGADRSGLFCAVAVLLEKLQLERHVSVLNTLRQIRLRRQTAIPNKEQVKFCYQCVSASQEENSIYYNL